MSFTFTNYAAIPPQDSMWNNALKKVLEGYTEGTKAKYLQPGLEEELKKAKLYNQYYGKDMESQIGLRGAQTKQANAHTSLLGEQTRGAHIENQYMPQKMQAQIADYKAKAQKARLIQMIQEQVMGGGAPMQEGQGGAPGQPGNMQMYNGQGMPNPNQQQAQGMPQPNPQQNGQGGGQSIPGMNYAKAAMIMQALGQGKPNIVNANGKNIAITPYGNFDTGVAGLTERDTQLAKEDAKKISGLEKVVLDSEAKIDTFNDLNEILGSPEYEAIRQMPQAGNFENWVTGKFGTPEQQNLVGRANTLMGNIIKDSARDFAGQFRVGEQALLNGMKPNPGDSLDVMKGKAEALTYLTTMLSKRAEAEANFMRTYNMTPLEARHAASKAVKPKEIKEQIHSILNPKKPPPITADEARAELERRRASGGMNG